MRSMIDRVVHDLDEPDPFLLEQARRSALRTEDAHARLIQEIPAFHAIEQAPPGRVRPCPATLRIAAFNVERLKDRPAVRNLMRQAGADITLFSEVDLGMARSGNTHNLRDLITDTGEGYLFGIEFVELDLGDRGEMRAHSGERNARSLHGNAIVTGLALEAPRLIPLDESGLWFSGFEGAQRRIGGRMALAARLDAARGPCGSWAPISKARPTRPTGRLRCGTFCAPSMPSLRASPA